MTGTSVIIGDIFSPVIMNCVGAVSRTVIAVTAAVFLIRAEKEAEQDSHEEKQRRNDP